MAWRDAGDGEDRDPFAGAIGTFVIHLFDHDGGKSIKITRYVADKGKEMAKQDSNKPWQTLTTLCWMDNV